MDEYITQKTGVNDDESEISDSDNDDEDDEETKWKFYLINLRRYVKLSTQEIFI